MDLTADDYVALQQLYARYSWAVDGLTSIDDYIDCWTPDGEHRAFIFAPDFPKGHEALRAAAKGFVEGRPKPLYHWNTSIVIEPAAHGANGKCYFMAVFEARDSAPLGPAYLYHDELVKVDGRWYFRTRTLGPRDYDPNNLPYV
jgi:hypothetical protein